MCCVREWAGNENIGICLSECETCKWYTPFDLWWENNFLLDVSFVCHRWFMADCFVVGLWWEVVLPGMSSLSQEFDLLVGSECPQPRVSSLKWWSGMGWERRQSLKLNAIDPLSKANGPASPSDLQRKIVAHPLLIHASLLSTDSTYINLNVYIDGRWKWLDEHKNVQSEVDNHKNISLINNSSLQHRQQFPSIIPAQQPSKPYLFFA